MTGNSSIETVSKKDAMRRKSKPRFLASNLEQIRATNPNYSVWLEASAGSGKTEVLIKRVIRLIINGALAEKILCLTYSNAASVEIRTRLQKNLNELLKLNQEQLSVKIRNLSEDDYSFDIKTVRNNILNWQTNFHKMRVNTIHGYCDYILRNFPIEAGVPPNFNIASTLEVKELLLESISLGLKDMTKSFDNNNLSLTSKRLIAELSSYATVKQINDYIKKLIMKSNRFVAGIRKIHKKNIFYSKNPLANLSDSLIEKIYFEMYDKLAQILKFDIEQNFEPQINSFLTEFNSLAPLFQNLNLVSAKGQPKTTLTTFKKLFSDLASEKFKNNLDKVNYIAKVLLVFSKTDKCYLIRKESSISAFIDKNQGHKAADAFSHLLEKCEKFSIWYSEFDDHNKKKKLIHFNSALTILAIKVLNNYNSLKASTTLLDFDDLIYHTKRLLIEGDIEQPWILYKLDGGIDHLLLDEAQDTSSDQWQIIEALFANFFIRDAGQTDKDKRSKMVKTIFVVGDFKQSIYSFQGAKPQAMKTMKERFEKIHKENNLKLQKINLPYSYRSGQEILNFIDMIYSEEEIALLGIEKSSYEKHLAIENNPASTVEVYSCQNKSEKKPRKNLLGYMDDCLASLKHEEPSNTGQSYIQEVGERIAKYIKRNVAANKFKFQDVMILLRRRTSQMPSLVLELQKHNIPIHGVDRIDLLEHMATIDCLNILRYYLQSEDNYTLFSLLTSPLIGLSFQEVSDFYTECDNFIDKLTNNSNPNLDQIKSYKNYFNLLKVIDHKNNNYKFEIAYNFLSKFLSNKESLASDIFFETLFNSHDLTIQEYNLDDRANTGFFDNSYNKLTSHYGLEVKDLIEEILNVIKELEDKNYTIYEILAYFDQNTSDGFEIKREVDKIKNQDAVRILTIHAAKGLEAPVVILADVFKKFDSNRNLKEAWYDRDISICVNSYNDISASHIEKFTSELLNDQLKEFFRLLYVAMTRASEKLVIYVEKKEDKVLSNESDNFMDNEFSWQSLIIDKLKEQQSFSKNKNLQLYLDHSCEEDFNNNSSSTNNEKHDLLYLSSSEVEKMQSEVDPTFALNENIIEVGEKVEAVKLDLNNDKEKVTVDLSLSDSITENNDKLTIKDLLNPSIDIIYKHPKYPDFYTKSESEERLNKQERSANIVYGNLFHQAIADYDQLIIDKKNDYKQLRFLATNKYKLTTDLQKRLLLEIDAMIDNQKINNILKKSFKETDLIGTITDDNNKEIMVSATIDLWYRDEKVIYIYDLKTHTDCTMNGSMYNQLTCYGKLIKNIFSNCEVVLGVIFSKETKLEYLQ